MYGDYVHNLRFVFIPFKKIKKNLNAIECFLMIDFVHEQNEEGKPHFNNWTLILNLFSELKTCIGA